MSASDRLNQLCRQLDQLFPAPSVEAGALAQPLAELVRVLGEGVESAALEPALDSFEDVLEALMHRANWPMLNGGSERGPVQ